MIRQQVAEGLYVVGEAVAADRQILAAHGISHVVNCVGALYPEYFATEGIQYKTLWLNGERLSVYGSSGSRATGALNSSKDGMKQ
jgi:hypothetical protein